MGTCQQQWCDPADFEIRTCGAETDRREGDRFVCYACAGKIRSMHLKIAEQMQCPLCWRPLTLVPAIGAHAAHAADALARKCTNPSCTFICHQGDEGPVPEIASGLPKGS